MIITIEIIKMSDKEVQMIKLRVQSIEEKVKNFQSQSFTADKILFVKASGFLRIALENQRLGEWD